jgi:hypothetical protein
MVIYKRGWCNRIFVLSIHVRGRSRGGGGAPRSPPLKLERIWFFGVKSWFYAKIFSRLPPLGAIFLSAPPPLTWNPGSAPACISLYLPLHNFIYLPGPLWRNQTFCIVERRHFTIYTLNIDYFSTISNSFGISSSLPIPVSPALVFHQSAFLG